VAVAQAWLARIGRRGTPLNATKGCGSQFP